MVARLPRGRGGGFARVPGGVSDVPVLSHNFTLHVAYGLRNQMYEKGRPMPTHDKPIGYTAPHLSSLSRCILSALHRHLLGALEATLDC